MRQRYNSLVSFIYSSDSYFGRLLSYIDQVNKSSVADVSCFDECTGPPHQSSSLCDLTMALTIGSAMGSTVSKSYFGLLQVYMPMRTLNYPRPADNSKPYTYTHPGRLIDADLDLSAIRE